MILCLFILTLLHIYLNYNRNIRFYATPYSTLNLNLDNIYSPVEGTIVYCQMLLPGKTITSSKRGRVLPIPILANKSSYIHIGIFMSPMNNHHLLSCNSGRPPISYDIGDKLFPMTGFFENLLPMIWLRDWLDRKDFLFYNRRTVFHYPVDGIYMSMIYDKYVAKFTPSKESIGDRPILGFVSRGSQLDIIIPIDGSFLPEIKSVGDKVDFNTLLARRL